MDTHKHKQLHVSLVIPAYNEERYLKATLNSVAKQTVMPDEVIVVDNNSTDSTAAIARSYLFVTLVRETTQGKGYASHRGFLSAKNELIARIDADTILEPNWIETATKYFIAHDQIAAITGKCYFYDYPMRRIISAYHAFFQNYVQGIIAGTPILWASNMMVRKSVWQEVVANEQVPYIHEDIDMTLKFHAAGYQIVRLRGMVASVSLIKDQTSLSYIWEYFMIWPDTYTNNKQIIRSYIIRVLGFFVFLTILPLDFIRYIQHRFSRQKKSD